MGLAARRNRLLASLPDAELRRWVPRLKAVEMKRGQVLYEPGAMPTHAYFPTTAIVSLLRGPSADAAGEVALIGNEGIVGLPIFMGGEAASEFAVVQSAGWGFRLAAKAMKDECRDDTSVLMLLLRFTQALIAQMGQTAICNRRHSPEQQLCRRFLAGLDRVEGNELAMTHEQIAQLLGMSRGSVTQAASRLRDLGVIRYARGRISTPDRRALEQRSCECYAVVRDEYEKLLPAGAESG